MLIPQVETERLILRGFVESDLDAYAEMCGDPEVMRYLGGQPLTRAEAWRSMSMMVGHWYLRGYGLWAVEERATGQTIGRIGCWQPEGWLGLEVGWTLHRPYWGRGYATEAARVSVDYAFSELGQLQVIHYIDPQNQASQRVALKLGAKVIQTAPLFGRDVLVYAIKREDWQLSPLRLKAE